MTPLDGGAVATSNRQGDAAPVASVGARVLAVTDVGVAVKQNFTPSWKYLSGKK